VDLSRWMPRPHRLRAQAGSASRSTAFQAPDGGGCCLQIPNPRGGVKGIIGHRVRIQREVDRLAWRTKTYAGVRNMESPMPRHAAAQDPFVAFASSRTPGVPPHRSSSRRRRVRAAFVLELIRTFVGPPGGAVVPPAGLLPS